MIGKLIKQADYALLATVLYVLALGLYSLFVDDRVPMPSWLRIHDLGHLKELLAGVVVVAIAVIFLGQALTWDGTSDLLAPGLASAAVIAALALFLWQAARERHMEIEDEPDASSRAGRRRAQPPRRRRRLSAGHSPGRPVVRQLVELRPIAVSREEAAGLVVVAGRTASSGRLLTAVRRSRPCASPLRPRIAGGRSDRRRAGRRSR